MTTTRASVTRRPSALAVAIESAAVVIESVAAVAMASVAAVSIESVGVVAASVVNGFAHSPGKVMPQLAHSFAVV